MLFRKAKWDNITVPVTIRTRPFLDQWCRIDKYSKFAVLLPARTESEQMEYAIFVLEPFRIHTESVSVTALILGFDDSTLSQRLLINVLLKSCISVLLIILVELVSMWLGSLCKDSPRF